MTLDGFDLYGATALQCAKIIKPCEAVRTFNLVASAHSTPWHSQSQALLVYMLNEFAAPHQANLNFLFSVAFMIFTIDFDLYDWQVSCRR
jgi:hypothetical protein